MRSSIYIHELPSYSSDIQEVGIDFTASPAHELLGDGTGNTAFLKSLDVLGAEWVERPGYATFSGYLAVRGSTDKIRANAPKLEAAVGPIKRYYGSKGQSPWKSDYLGRLLGTIAQRELPNLPENATLMRAVGLLAEPLGENSNDDGCNTYYARRRNTAAVDESGQAISLYDVRDIGGLLIDRTGRPAQERYTFTIKISESTYDLLHTISDEREQPTREIIDTAMARLVARDDPVNLASPVQITDSYKRLILGVNRVDAKHLIGVYPDASMSQLVTTALSSFADSQTTPK